MTKRLVCRVVPHNTTVVFATPERAKFVARLHDAIESSRTWGEFRKAVPPAEYSKIVRGFDDADEPRPKSTDPFDGEQIAGWSDGDYPPWLQQEMEEVLPVSVLRKFGSLEATLVNGSCWMVPEENLQATCAALRALGWEVEELADVRFW